MFWLYQPIRFIGISS